LDRFCGSTSVVPPMGNSRRSSHKCHGQGSVSISLTMNTITFTIYMLAHHGKTMVDDEYKKLLVILCKQN